VECYFSSVITELMESAGGIPGVIWMQSCQGGLAVIAMMSDKGLRMVNGCYQMFSLRRIAIKEQNILQYSSLLCFNKCTNLE